MDEEEEFLYYTWINGDSIVDTEKGTITVKKILKYYREYLEQKAKKLTPKRVCGCKIPEPNIKNSENGISTYCGKCSKTIIK